MAEAARDLLPDGLTADEFEVWYARQPDGNRYELEAGKVIELAPERFQYGLAKAWIWRQLQESVEQNGLNCQALPDGIALRVSRNSQREPDVAVRCGEPVKGKAIRYDDPIVLVEVSSPSTAHVDGMRKVTEYLGLPSVRHYLIVDLDDRNVVHFAWTAPSAFETRILQGGQIGLDPPGLSLDLDAILAFAERPAPPG